MTRRQAVQRQPQRHDRVAQRVELVVVVDGDLHERGALGELGVHADPGQAGHQLVVAVTDVDRHHAGALEQGIGLTRHHEVAGVDHHDAVAHLLHVVEEVGGEQHRDAERAEAGHQLEHLLASERIEAGGRLVEQHQLGIAHERLGQLGALAHPGGEAADRPEARLVETDQVEDVRSPLAGGTRRQPAELAEGGHEVRRRLIGRQAVVLGHVAEPRPHGDGIGGDIDAAHLDPPLRRVGEPEQQPEHRGLAGAVGADQADAPARERHRQPVEGDDRWIALGQALDAKEGTGFHDPPSLPGLTPDAASTCHRRSGHSPSRYREGE